MNNAILASLTIIFLPSICFSMLPTKSKSQEIYSPKIHALQTIVPRYQKFLNQFGQQETGDLLQLMESLFAPDVTKYIKSVAVAEKIEGLHAQILKEKEETGAWTVHETGSRFTDREKRIVMAHFEIATEKMGTLIIMKKIHCNNDGLIQEINEVFTTIKK